MSRSIHKAWIKEALCNILSSTAVDQNISHSLRVPGSKCVQIVAIREELNLLTISDGDVFICAFLTEDAFEELTNEYSIDTLKYSLVNVVDFCFSTPTQAAGNRDMTDLSKINGMFPLVLHCFKVTYLGASDCTVIGNPTALNNSHTIMNLVRPFAKRYCNFRERLAITQFPIQRVLPDWEGTFDDRSDFNTTRPLQKSDFLEPESQVAIIEQLGSFDFKDIVVILPGILEDQREFERENGHQNSKGRNKRHGKQHTDTASTSSNSNSANGINYHHKINGNNKQKTQRATSSTAAGSTTADGWTETIREDYEDYDTNKIDWSTRWGTNMETQVASEDDSGADDADFPTDSDEEGGRGDRRNRGKKGRSQDQMIPLPPLTADQVATGLDTETQHSQWQGTLVDEDSQTQSETHARASSQRASSRVGSTAVTPQDAVIPVRTTAVTPLIHAPYHDPTIPIPTPTTLVLCAASKAPPTLQLPSGNSRSPTRHTPGPSPMVASNRPNRNLPSALDYGTGTQLDTAVETEEGSVSSSNSSVQSFDDDESRYATQDSHTHGITIGGSRSTKKSKHSLRRNNAAGQVAMSDSQTLFTSEDGSQLETQSSQDSCMQALLHKLTRKTAADASTAIGASISTTAHSPIAQAAGLGSEHTTTTSIPSASKSSAHISQSQPRSQPQNASSPFAVSMSPIRSTQGVQAAQSSQSISGRAANSSSSTQLTVSEGSQELPIVPTGAVVTGWLDPEVITQEERGLLFDWSSQYTSQFLYPATGSAAVATSQTAAADDEVTVSAVDNHAFVCVEAADASEHPTTQSAVSSSAAASSSSTTAMHRSPALFQTTQPTASHDISTPTRSHKPVPTPSSTQRSADSYISPTSQPQVIIINNNDSAPNRMVSRSGRELQYKPPQSSQSSAEGEHSSSTESQYSVPPSIQRKDISTVPEVAQQSSKVPTRAPFVLDSSTAANTNSNQLPPAGYNSKRNQRMTSSAALLYSQNQSDSEISTIIKPVLPLGRSNGIAVQKEDTIAEEEEVEKESEEDEEDSPVLHKRRLSKLLEESISSRKAANLNVSFSKESSSSSNTAAAPSSSSTASSIKPVTEDELVRMTSDELLQYISQLQLPAHLTKFDLADWQFNLSRYLHYVIREMGMVRTATTNARTATIDVRTATTNVHTETTNVQPTIPQSSQKQEKEETRLRNQKKRSLNSSNSGGSSESIEESDESSLKPRKYQKLYTTMSKANNSNDNTSSSKGNTSGMQNTRSKPEKSTLSTRSATSSSTTAVLPITATAVVDTATITTAVATKKKNKKNNKNNKKEKETEKGTLKRSHPTTTANDTTSTTTRANKKKKKKEEMEEFETIGSEHSLQPLKQSQSSGYW